MVVSWCVSFEECLYLEECLSGCFFGEFDGDYIIFYDAGVCIL